MAKKYDQDFKERALRMLAEALPEHAERTRRVTTSVNSSASRPTRCGFGINRPKSTRVRTLV